MLEDLADAALAFFDPDVGQVVDWRRIRQDTRPAGDLSLRLVPPSVDGPTLHDAVFKSTIAVSMSMMLSISRWQSCPRTYTSPTLTTVSRMSGCDDSSADGGQSAGLVRTRGVKSLTWPCVMML